jgi:pilus assembly protein CpaB
VRQRSGGMLILVLSIVAGLVAAYLSVGFLRGVTRSSAVLVAAREIAPFTPLTADLFTVKHLPQSAVPADAVTNMDDLADRYARTLLLADTVIRQGHLAESTGTQGSLAAKLTEAGQPGMRALAIAVDNATAVGGTLRAGDKVDIIAAVRLDRTDAPATTISKVIARAVSVLERAEGEGSGKSTVVVMVTGQMAEAIAFAQMEGTIYLATNPYRTAGTEREPTPGITPDNFLTYFGGR